MTQDELLRLIDEAAADGRPTLNLAGRGLDELPPEIGKLTQLTSLDLRSNRLRFLPSSIGELTNLIYLYLSSNQLSSLSNSVGQLTNLIYLDLCSNRLSSLPDSIGQLINLKYLYLRFNQLRSLPNSVRQLTNLIYLDFCSNQLSFLHDGIGQLTNLIYLSLSSNQLNSLPDSVGQLTNLKYLYLSSNQLNSLPDSVGQLTNLKYLYLRSNQLSSLPMWAKSFDKLKKLDLRHNPLPIPPEILGPKETWEDPRPATETLGFYFSLQTETGSVPLYEAKLILIGAGGAGKTSLARKINNEAYELTKDEKSTEGIDVIRWDFPLSDGNTFRVNIWDFGGQEIYHATHQFFLTKRSLYLLVADTRQEDTDFYYWLKIVELLSDNSPVLIIKNEKQDRQCEIDEGLFKSQFNNLKESFPTNLKDNRGLADIRDAICYHISKLPHVGTVLPAFWIKVRTNLEEAAKRQNTLTLEQYFDICRHHGCNNKEQMLLVSDYLHDLGVCLHFQDDKLLKRTVILKPEWATIAVYKVADSDTIRNNQGHFTEADTGKIWADGQYADLRDELLQLMNRFKLAYEIPNNPGHYIAPQLLPIGKPTYPWDTANNLILCYRYDFMPKGILTRFIVETHPLIENQAYVWKNGVILADKWARAQIIENYLKNEITIHISGSNQKNLLEVVRHEFWKIHASYERLEYKELIPCNCPKCKGSNKPESYPYDLLMKYIGDRRYDIECRASYQKVDVCRLISDIGDNPMSEQKIRERGASPTTINITNLKGNLLHQATQEKNTDMSTINQYGQGDNIAGDQVLGDKIQTQINNNPDLAQAARDIKALLNELSEEYNPNSAKGQAKIEEAALAEIKQNPTLKQRTIKALQSAGDEALEQTISHPVAKVVVEGVKGFLQG